MLKLSRLPSGAPEIFASIQGEGPTRGLPSVFVRLAHCNLRCTWCDTKYTWDWETYDPAAEVVEHPAEAVVDAVERLHHRNVVITGGEPLIQQRAVVPLADRLKAGGHRIEVETNGTILPLVELASAVDQWNVSPKLSNSRNPDWQRLVPEVLSWYSAQPNTVFKFVVAQPEDLREIQRVCEDY